MRDFAGIPGIPCEFELAVRFTLHQKLVPVLVCRLKQKYKTSSTESEESRKTGSNREV